MCSNQYETANMMMMVNSERQDVAMTGLYRAVTHPEGWSGLPHYELRDNRFYRTVSHLLGWSGLPDYEIRADGKVTRTSATDDPPSDELLLQCCRVNACPRCGSECRSHQRRDSPLPYVP